MSSINLYIKLSVFYYLLVVKYLSEMYINDLIIAENGGLYHKNEDTVPTRCFSCNI